MLNHPTRHKGKLGMSFNSRYPWNPLTAAGRYFIKVGLAGKRHGAWDIITPVGTPLYAPGRIQQYRVQENHPDYGKVIYAASLDVPGIQFIFGHLSSIGNPRLGKIWKKDELIGWSGNTGKSTAPHLHFEVREGDTKVDPARYVEK